jgi:predicted nucleotidyltransferase component of viral defense system
MELTPLQENLIKAFQKTPLRDQFYLTGGTLLSACYLHHRRSLDLDFFTNGQFALGAIQKHVSRMAKLSNTTLKEMRHISDRYEWQVEGKEESTKIEFVWYDFKPLKQHPTWNNIQIDSLEDIAANKVMALLERHEPKDIFDLYYILNKKAWGVETPIHLMKKKFGLPITPLTFLGDAERALKRLDAIQGLLLTNTPEEQQKLFDVIHAYFDKKARKYLDRQWK